MPLHSRTPDALVGPINLQIPDTEITTAQLKVLSLTSLRNMVARGRRLKVRLQSTQLLEELLEKVEQWRRQATILANRDKCPEASAEATSDPVCPPVNPSAAQPMSADCERELVRLIRASSSLGIDAGSSLLRRLRLRRWILQVESG